MSSIWSGFYSKSLQERQQLLQLVFPGIALQQLELHQANNMIENCIGVGMMPLGLAVNIKVNGRMLVVPMQIEEPSVVAAVSGAGKTISEFGGFECTAAERNLISAQIQLLDIEDERIDECVAKLESQRDTLIETANEYCRSMQQRGGGVVDIKIRKIRKSLPRQNSFWLVVHFLIDTCDAMGANCASTVAEGIAPTLATLTHARIGFRIVSNLSPERISTATFQIPIEKLGYKGFHGKEVGEKIVEAYEWARDDPFRAVTHNKGIMNGIDGVAIATGQDWRAIEAASHSWALKDGLYQPLSKYEITIVNGVEYLRGTLSLPITVGTQGGVLKSNSLYQYTLGLMGYPDSKTFAMVLVAIGLAQNFAALRALSTEGIQKGHMALHARNIALAAGAPAHCVNECVAFMVQSNRISSNAATEYLEAHHLGLKLSRNFIDYQSETFPSMLYFEDSTTKGITLNIAFKSYGKQSVNIFLTNQSAKDLYVDQLFGVKTYNWIVNVLHMMDQIKLSTTTPSRVNYILSQKLKVISILINILAQRLLKISPTARSFISNCVKEALWDNSATVKLEGSPMELPRSLIFDRKVTAELDQLMNLHKDLEILVVGLPLFLALWQVFECNVRQSVGSMTLARLLLDEQNLVLHSILSDCTKDTENAFCILSKRLQATLFLYCDAIQFDESLLIPQVFSFMETEGRNLELVQMASHDLSPARLARELTILKQEPDVSIGIEICNSFLMWLWNNGLRKSDILKNLHDVDMMTENSRHFVLKYLQFLSAMIQKTQKPPYLDTSGIKKATILYQKYYDVPWIASFIPDLNN